MPETFALTYKKKKKSSKPVNKNKQKHLIIFLVDKSVINYKIMQLLGDCKKKKNEER